MEARMEPLAETVARPPCGNCGNFIEGFSTFRCKEVSPFWNGEKPIVRYCLKCAKVKDEINEIMDGMLY